MEHSMIDYSKFFRVTKRLAGEKEIAIVRGEMVPELIKTLINDQEIDDRVYKAFFIICLSGGLRVTEGLDLKKGDFIEDEGDLYANVSVLKKRSKKETRYIKIHPEGKGFVKEVLRTKIGQPFHWNRTTALRKIQRYFKVPGICNHTLRHSMISYYLFEEGLSREVTAKLVHVTQKMIDNYAHLDERKVLANVFKKKDPKPA